MILHELISYDVLRLIWWALLGVLLIGFALTDGFDLGTGTLLPFVARSDVERRVVINTIGPVWEGNQVWLILGGGGVLPVKRIRRLAPVPCCARVVAANCMMSNSKVVGRDQPHRVKKRRQVPSLREKVILRDAAGA